MSLFEILASQLSDVFRVGLLVMLLLTVRNTYGRTGLVLPLAAGLLFVAVLIPMTNADGAEELWVLIAVGLLSNAAIVAVVLAGYVVVTRSVPRDP